MGKTIRLELPVTTAHGSDLTCGKDSIIWKPLLKKIFRQASFINVVSTDLKKMAMAVGVPVVASRRFGIPYMVEDGKTGYLIEPENTENIVDSVCKVIGDDKLSSKFSASARIIASKRFKASVICKQTYAAYKELID